jgi:hypothetical protein
MSKITPSLESITIRGKYLVRNTDFDGVKSKIFKAVQPATAWKLHPVSGESVTLICFSRSDWMETVKNVRSGIPLYFSLVAIEHIDNNSIILEVECRPAMWHKIASLNESKFTENQVQEALLECRGFVKQTMSVLRGKEVERARGPSVTACIHSI